MGKSYDLKGLTSAQVNLLEALLEDNKEDEIYWGNKEQFIKRRDDLLMKIQSLQKAINQYTVKEES